MGTWLHCLPDVFLHVTVSTSSSQENIHLLIQLMIVLGFQPPICKEPFQPLSIPVKVILLVIHSYTEVQVVCLINNYSYNLRAEGP